MAVTLKQNCSKEFVFVPYRFQGRKIHLNLEISKNGCRVNVLTFELRKKWF